MVSASQPSLKLFQQPILTQVDLLEQMQFQSGSVKQWPSGIYTHGQLQEEEMEFQQALI